MGDFFYYGQKDTIQRLNELAGRGAVVASYGPKVGMSPVGGANGYMDPAWLDPGLPILTSLPIGVGAGFANKYGYGYLQGGQGQRLYKIATLVASSGSAYASLRIDAIIGGWSASDLTAMTITLGSRDAAGFNVDWSSSRYIPTTVRFLAYKEDNDEISVYLFFLAGGFAQASFQMMGLQTTTYSNPVPVSSVTGTIVWDSSAPPGNSTYKSPRSRGMGAVTSAGNGTSFDHMVEVRSRDGDTSATTYLSGAAPAGTVSAGAEVEHLRLGVSGQAGINYSGFWSMYLSSGVGSPFKDSYRLTMKARDTGSGTFSPTLLSISGNGTVYMPVIKAGSTNATLINEINTSGAPNTELVYFGVNGNPNPCVGIRTSTGAGGWSGSPGILYVAKNVSTNRSINAAGTVNTSGNDYAEYFTKSLFCSLVTRGQIIGITNGNEITDQWIDAVLFGIKSTDPSFVGGDNWAKTLGQRPSPEAGMEPVKPVRIPAEMGESESASVPADYAEVIVKPGDADEAWEAKIAAYAVALKEWEQALEVDRIAMEAFDTKLENARSHVDRIAIAGRVPVNVLGAQPGDYIVPVQDGAGIKGIAVHEDDLSMKQYLHAVGRVISIEPDGRAYVMVKAV